jgi:hypothetical protein
MESKQLLCMKWGTLYGAEYVNRLYSMVERNITGPFRFFCLTDDPTGIRPDVECLPCPEIDLPLPHRNYGWRKVTLWAEDLFGIEGEVLFLDVDLVIMDNIDCFFEYGDGFVVCRNWTQLDKRIGNTSLYRFTVGSHCELLSNLLENSEQVLAEYANSQTYISSNVEKMTFWPDDWCCSFKVHCVPKGIKRWIVEPKPPENARVVAFTGDPNPDAAAAGHWPCPWYKRFYKHVRPSPWITEHWCA